MRTTYQGRTLPCAVAVESHHRCMSWNDRTSSRQPGLLSPSQYRISSIAVPPSSFAGDGCSFSTHTVCTCVDTASEHGQHDSRQDNAYTTFCIHLHALNALRFLSRSSCVSPLCSFLLPPSSSSDSSCKLSSRLSSTIMLGSTAACWSLRCPSIIPLLPAPASFHVSASQAGKRKGRRLSHRSPLPPFTLPRTNNDSSKEAVLGCNDDGQSLPVSPSTQKHSVNRDLNVRRLMILTEDSLGEAE